MNPTQLLDHYDFIIVGSGASGCLIANRLSENSNFTVLLIEAGGDDSKPGVQNQDKWYITQKDPEIDWGYKTEPETNLGGRQLGIPMAKIAGGCTSHHGAVYVRGSPYDYDEWAALTGDVTWKYNNLLPHFKSFESFKGDPKYRGQNGEFDVIEPTQSEFGECYIKSAMGLGYPLMKDYNSDRGQGVGRTQSNCINRVRQSAYQRFIVPVLENRKNLHVVLKSFVSRILCEQKGAELQATGVVLEDNNNKEITVSADKEIIICAGTIGSPKLLMLSGIGDKNHLSEMGIDLVRDLPGVGLNLHDHPGINRMFVSDRPMPPTDYYIQSILIASLDGTIDKHVPDFIACVAAREGFVEGFKLPPDLEAKRNHLFSMVGFVSKTKSRGYLKLKSKNPKDLPKIVMNYLSDEHDVIVLERMAEIMSKIANSDEIQSKFPSTEVLPGTQFPNIRDYIKARMWTAFHSVGTCKMGNDSLSVVDSQLKVIGISGLRVADASIMPIITSGNTNVPTSVIAAKAADMILNAWIK